MKKIFLYLSILLLVFASCDKGCKVKRPKNLLSIDWHNYNDVYIVKWNYTTDCNSIKKNNDMGKTIKVSGWIFQGPSGNTPISPSMFDLIDNKEDIFYWNFDTGITICVYEPYLIDTLETIFSTVDIARKCYITGMLSYYTWGCDCCTAYPQVVIDDVNDIYFE